MRSSAHVQATYDNRPSPRARLAAGVLSLGIVALVLATLIAMGALDNLPGGPGERLTAVRMSTSRAPDQQRQRQKASTRDVAKSAPVAVTLPQPAPAPVPSPKVPAVRFIPMSRSDFAASDISKLGHQGEASPGNSSSAYGPGEGPGGARLYNAEWYRRPSRAELAGYIRNGAPPGSWAMIACKTAERFHVEDCIQLGESPPGSGLSRALREAAWQFLVRPPRVDGKAQIGAWVRIRFDFLDKGGGVGEE